MTRNYMNNFIVRIEGGLGAQIIGLSVYFYLKNIGCNVMTDISYFDTPLRYAKLGDNKVTHWDWQVDNYGMNFNSFDWINLNKLAPFFEDTQSDPKEGMQILKIKKALENFKKIKNEDFKDYHFTSEIFSHSNSIDNFFSGGELVYIKDGPNKSKLYHQAMREENIKNKFESNCNNWKNILNTKNIKIHNCIFIHLRRGDYLNIKSFNIVSEDAVYKIIKKLSDVFKNVVILSDASENYKFTKKLKERFEKVFWLDTLSPFDTHMILRQAKLLICSNSQFSTTAAYLGNCFSIIPQKHTSDNDHIFQYKNNVTSFALLNN